jgi:general secretion pathway protein K
LSFDSLRLNHLSDEAGVRMGQDRVSQPRHKGRQGSALMIVLWAVALMSATLLALVQFMDLGLSESAAQGKNSRALQLAESGLALGLHPSIRPWESLLQQSPESGESFAVTLRSEGARLNINALLLNNNREVLADLFQRWKVDDKQIGTLIDRMMDWVDEDSLKRLNGSEKEEYEKLGFSGYPSNKPFQSLEEMELMPGIEFLAEAKPDWKDFFTVWGDGKLDVNQAPADLIASFCQVGGATAQFFVQSRPGADKVEGTKDDFRYTEMKQVRSALGMSESLFQELEGRITLESDYRRIVSVGKVVNFQRTVAVVVRIKANPIEYLTWMEY